MRTQFWSSTLLGSDNRLPQTTASRSDDGPSMGGVDRSMYHEGGGSEYATNGPHRRGVVSQTDRRCYGWMVLHFLLYFC